MANKPAPLGPFLGMNTLKPDYRLGMYQNGKKAGDYLRNAVNVDLTASGTLSRRTGTTLALAGTDLHSLWADGDMALAVEGNGLYRLTQTPAGLVKTLVRGGMTPGLRVSCARASGDVYWSNGVLLERIRNGVSAQPAIPTPNPAPVVAADATGSLPAGQYQVAITYRDATTGEQSGATWPVQVAVPEKGALTLSGIPVGSRQVCVWLSPQNGDQLFLAETLAPGISSARYPTLPALGGRCSTLGLRPMPAGTIVREHNGRLLVANGAILYYSEPFAYGLHNPARGYIPFPAGVSVVEPCEGGVYVVADQTYWLAGADVAKADVVPILPYGAVAGTGGSSPTEKRVWWFGARGLVIGDISGQAKAVQEDSVAVDAATAGATFYREHNGIRQVLSSLFGAEPSKAMATSFMTAEVIRKESML